MHSITNNQDMRERIRLLSEKDLSISYFCGSGAGGQARNKVASGVLIRHEESGALGRASDSRSQADNKRKAFERMCATPQMKFWLAKKLYEVRNEETIAESVEKETSNPASFKYEVKDAQGRWHQVDADHFESELAKQE